MPDLTQYQIGFVGLGLMGRPMAMNLLRAGARLTVTSRSPGPVEALAAEGIATAASPHAVAAASEVIILMVTDTAAADAVLHGPAGVLAGLADGKLVIDMGTTKVPETRAWAREALALGADYLDAPVSGGQVAAIDASLTIMAGGDGAAFDRARPILGALGRHITHVGGVGAGQVAKTVNQVIVGMTIGAVAEALTLARRAGVDPAKVRDAIRGGFAESRILELHGGRMVASSFEPGGRATVQRKDVVEALELAAGLGLVLPGLERNRTLWERMIEKGWGDLDHSALIKVIEES